jgi:hypothetical protein
MVDILTDFASVDDNWHYLALTDDLRPGLEPTPGARLLAGNNDDVWVIEVLEVTDDLIRFKLVEPARTPAG